MNSIWLGSVSGGLNVIVADHATGLEVARVVHQLEIVELPTSFSIFTVSDGLLNGCRDSSSQSITQPTSAPLLGVVLERRHHAVPDLVVVRVVGKRPSRARIDAHPGDPEVGGEREVALEVLEVLVVHLLRARRPREPEEIAVGPGSDAGDLEVRDRRDGP